MKYLKNIKSRTTAYTIGIGGTVVAAAILMINPESHSISIVASCISTACSAIGYMVYDLIVKTAAASDLSTLSAENTNEISYFSAKSKTRKEIINGCEMLKKHFGITDQYYLSNQASNYFTKLQQFYCICGNLIACIVVIVGIPYQQSDDNSEKQTGVVLFCTGLGIGMMTHLIVARQLSYAKIIAEAKKESILLGKGPLFKRQGMNSLKMKLENSNIIDIENMQEITNFIKEEYADYEKESIDGVGKFFKEKYKEYGIEQKINSQEAMNLKN
jgi:hypothetical protein